MCSVEGRNRVHPTRTISGPDVRSVPEVAQGSAATVPISTEQDMHTVYNESRQCAKFLVCRNE